MDTLSIQEMAAKAYAALDRGDEAAARAWAGMAELAQLRARQDRIRARRAAKAAGAAHAARVDRVAGRYPYRPGCACGWSYSRGYVAEHAARGIADAHAAGSI